MSNVIDLSLLAAPDIVETLDYEEILSAMIADLTERDPSFTALVESDPAYKILEVAAYRELLIRQRVNDAARAVMLAYATGSDLEHLGALFGVERLVVDPGDPDAVPPVPPTYESDDRLRQRIQLAIESLSTAGPVDAYRYHALSADADVLDVSVTSPSAGQVLVTVLSAEGDGTPDQDLLDAVEAALTDRSIRPLTDQVTVQAAAIVNFEVTAELTLYEGPDAEVVRQAAEDAVKAYVDENHRLGRDITLSGLYAALHQPGVMKATISAPAADVTVQETEASWCTAVTVTVGGTGE